MEAHTGQWADGNQNVQISQISGSTIQITLNERSWHVPLEPATIPVGPQVTSAARLVRARSGILPYVDSAGHLDELSGWIGTPDPFAVGLIGGRGGTGKTRLAVELCELTRNRAGWLSGLLPGRVDPMGLRDLADTPNPRLVVIDYAETRVGQLEEVLSYLQRGASEQYPVRVLLLVRKAPPPGGAWTEALSGRRAWLQSVLDETRLFILDDTQPTAGDRVTLFDSAAIAFAERVKPPVALAEVTSPVLTEDAFGNPLLIVAAAYLAVHGRQNLPNTRAGLLEGLVQHEDQYWKSQAGEVKTDEVRRRRIVALATLTGAADETEAALLLRELTDLSDASNERRGELARWAHGLYRGPQWWNPLEPDLLGEYLVSTEFGGSPEILAAVLERDRPDRIVQALDTVARAAAYDRTFADAVRPVLSENLQRLCHLAAAQAAKGADLALLLGGATVSGALSRAASVIVVDSSVLLAALDALPSRNDVILNGLALTLTERLVKTHRELAAADPAVWNPEFGASLIRLSNRLAGEGRREEALSAITEAVTLYRELALADSAAWNPDLAVALNNLSNRLAEAGRHDDALAPIAEAVAIRRRLAAPSPGPWVPGLALALNNLSNHLAMVGRPYDALAAVTEAVTLYREQATAYPATYTPNLAMALNNLSNRLAEAGRHDDALAPITEAVNLYRELAAAHAAAYTPNLAMALNNLSNSLARAGQPNDALAAVAEAVNIRRQLAAANPVAWNPGLATALNNLSAHLAEAGRGVEALAAVTEAVTLYRELAEANTEAWNPNLAIALNNLSAFLAGVERREEPLVTITEAVTTLNWPRPLRSSQAPISPPAPRSTPATSPVSTDAEFKSGLEDLIREAKAKGVDMKAVSQVAEGMDIVQIANTENSTITFSQGATPPAPWKPPPGVGPTGA